MEGKTMVLSVLILSLVLAQVQVNAILIICCPSEGARVRYNVCRSTTINQSDCAKFAKCITQTSGACKAPYNHETLENSGDGVKSYRKLGCASSVCNGIIALEVDVNGAVEKCINACSEFCTKGSTGAIEVA